MHIPPFSLFSAISELFVTAGVLFVVRRNWTRRAFPFGLFLGVSLFEALVNVMYMANRSAAASAPGTTETLSTGMKIAFAAHGITGRNVQSNSRVETGGGAYLHLLNSPSSKLTLGMNIGLMGYQKNLSYYTFGQGGYFSPQSFVSVAFPVDWSGRSDRLSWRLNASLGVQSFTQKSSPYFPTDPSRNAAA